MTAHYRATIDNRKVNQRYIFGYIAFQAMEKDEEKFKKRVKELYVKFKCSLIRIEKQAG